MYTWIFSGVFLVFAILAILLGRRSGKKFIWQYSIARVIVVFGAALASMTLSSMICWAFGSLFYKVVSNALTVSPSLTSLLDSLPTAPYVLRALFSMLLAPIFFLIFFFVFKKWLHFLVRYLCHWLLKLEKRFLVWYCGKRGIPVPEREKPVDKPILDIFGREVEKKMGRRARKRREFNRKYGEFRAATPSSLSAWCGAACGFMIYCMLLVPLFGTVSVANSAVQFTRLQRDGALQTVGEIVDAADSNLGSFAVRFVGGDMIYSGLTTYPVNGKLASLNREAKVLDALGDVIVTMKDAEATPKESAKSLRTLGRRVASSDMLPMLTADLVSSATDSWSRGEKYAGIAFPDLGKNYNGFTIAFFDVLKTSDYDTIGDDIGCIVEVMALLVEEDTFKNMKSDGGIMAIFGDGELLADVMLEFLQNDHMAPLISNVTEVGINTMGRAVEMLADDDGVYDSFVEEMYMEWQYSKVYADAERVAYLEKAVKRVYDRHGIVLEDSTCSILVSRMIGKYGTGYMLKDDVRDFFGNSSGASNKAVVESGDTFRNKGMLITLDELTLEYQPVKKPKVEAKKLADVMASAIGLVGKLSDEGTYMGQTLISFGPVFDGFADCETVGEQKAALILTGLMQSPKFRTAIGFTVLDATEVATSINDGAAGEDSSYEKMLKSLGDTLEVLRTAKSGNATEAVEALLTDLTPESANTLQKLATPETVMQNGVPEQSAEAVSSMMSDMIGNVSEAKQNGMTDEEYQKEAAAMSTVMNVAMGVGDTERDTFGEGSKTGLSASEFVDRIADSDSVSKSVTDTVYENGSNTPTENPLQAGELSSEEEAEMIAALDARWKRIADSSDEAAKAEEQKKLIAIAQLLNVSIAFSGNSVVGA